MGYLTNPDVANENHATRTGARAPILGRSVNRGTVARKRRAAEAVPGPKLGELSVARVAVLIEEVA